MANGTKVAKSAQKKQPQSSTSPAKLKESRTKSTPEKKTPNKKAVTTDNKCTKQRGSSPRVPSKAPPSTSQKSPKSSPKKMPSPKSAASNKMSSDKQLKKAKSPPHRKSVSKKKSKPDLYKTRHNIGNRLAAGRVSSYKQTEMAVVFPEGYWTSLINPRETSSKSTNSLKRKRGVSADSEAKVKKASVKNEANKDEPVVEKKSTRLTPKIKSNSSGAKNTVKKEPSSPTSKGYHDDDSGKTQNDSKKAIKKSPKAKTDSSKKKTEEKIIAENKSKVSEKETKKSKFADIRPRATRIKRTACLNANAIVSLMFEREEPPQRVLPKRSSSSHIVNNYDSETSDSDSDYSDITFPNSKPETDSVRSGGRASKRKSSDSMEKSKPPQKRKKSPEKRRGSESKVEISPWSPPRRMASLNAQAILAACRDESNKKSKPVEEPSKAEQKDVKNDVKSEDAPNKTQSTSHDKKTPSSSKKTATIETKPSSASKPKPKEKAEKQRKSDISKSSSIQDQMKDKVQKSGVSTSSVNSVPVASQLNDSRTHHSPSDVQVVGVRAAPPGHGHPPHRPDPHLAPHLTLPHTSQGKHSMHFSAPGGARTLGTQTNFHQSGPPRHVEPTPPQPAFSQYGYQNQMGQYTAPPDPHYPCVRPSWNAFPSFRQPEPYSYSQHYKEPRLPHPGMRYAALTPPVPSPSPFDPHLALPSPHPMTSPPPQPCSTPSLMPQHPGYHAPPHSQYNPSSHPRSLPSVLVPGPQYPHQQMDAHGRSSVTPGEPSNHQMPTSQSQLPMNHHLPSRGQALALNPYPCQDSSGMRSGARDLSAHHEPHGSRPLSGHHEAHGTRPGRHESHGTRTGHHEPHGTRPGHHETHGTSSGHHETHRSRASHHESSGNRQVYESSGHPDSSVNQPGDNESSAKRLESWVRSAKLGDGRPISSSSDTSSVQSIQPPVSTAKPSPNASNDEAKNKSNPPVTTASTSKKESKTPKSKTILYNTGGSKFHSKPADHLRASQENSTPPVTTHLVSSLASQAVTSGNNRESGVPQHNTVGALVPTTQCLVTAQPPVVSSGQQGLGMTCGCPASPNAHLLACPQLTATIPVVPFTHYGNAFAVPAFDNQTPPVAFGYYQPAGPLIQTAEPCFVSHSIGLPHGQVKVLVHNTGLVRTDMCTDQDKVIKKDNIRSLPELRPKPAIEAAPVVNSHVGGVKSEMTAPEVSKRSHSPKKAKQKTSKQQKLVSGAVSSVSVVMVGGQTGAQATCSAQSTAMMVTGVNTAPRMTPTVIKPKHKKVTEKKMEVVSVESRAVHTEDSLLAVQPSTASVMADSSHLLTTVQNTTIELSTVVTSISRQSLHMSVVSGARPGAVLGMDHLMDPLTVSVDGQESTPNSKASSGKKSTGVVGPLGEKQDEVEQLKVKKKKKKKKKTRSDEECSKDASKKKAKKKLSGSKDASPKKHSKKAKEAAVAKISTKVTKTSVQSPKTKLVTSLKSPARKSLSPKSTSKSSHSKLLHKSLAKSSAKISDKEQSPKVTSKKKDASLSKEPKKKDATPTKNSAKAKETPSPKQPSKEAGRKEERSVVCEKRESEGSGGGRKEGRRTAWQWEGQAAMKLVPSCLPDTAPEMKRCFPAVKHRTDGEVIRERDCVLVKSGPRKKDIPFLAKICSLWETDGGEMMMTVFWFYRPEHTDTDRLPHHIPSEVFASKHRDVVPVACIEDKCYVLTYNEFCRYRAEATRVNEGAPPRPQVVPPPDLSNPRADTPIDFSLQAPSSNSANLLQITSENSPLAPQPQSATNPNFTSQLALPTDSTLPSAPSTDSTPQLAPSTDSTLPSTPLADSTPPPGTFTTSTPLSGPATASSASCTATPLSSPSAASSLLAPAPSTPSAPSTDPIPSVASSDSTSPPTSAPSLVSPSTISSLTQSSPSMMNLSSPTLSPSSIFPPASPSSHRDVLPPPTTDPECVFLCRRVYDVKLKRVLKNPQVHNTVSGNEQSHK